MCGCCLPLTLSINKQQRLLLILLPFADMAVLVCAMEVVVPQQQCWKLSPKEPLALELELEQQHCKTFKTSIKQTVDVSHNA